MKITRNFTWLVFQPMRLWLLLLTIAALMSFQSPPSLDTVIVLLMVDVELIHLSLHWYPNLNWGKPIRVPAEASVFNLKPSVTSDNSKWTMVSLPFCHINCFLWCFFFRELRWIDRCLFVHCAPEADPFGSFVNIHGDSMKSPRIPENLDPFIRDWYFLENGIKTFFDYIISSSITYLEEINLPRVECRFLYADWRIFLSGTFTTLPSSFSSLSQFFVALFFSSSHFYHTKFSMTIKCLKLTVKKHQQKNELKCQNAR